MRLLKLHGEKLLLKELKNSVNFFLKEVSSKGLIKDKNVYADDVASIASVRLWISSTCNSSRKKMDKL